MSEHVKPPAPPAPPVPHNPELAPWPGSNSGEPATIEHDVVVAEQTLEPPAPKRRGRPKKEAETTATTSVNEAGARLKSLVERIERLEEEKASLGSDISDMYKEAKSAGFDVKVLRMVMRLRKQDPADVEEQRNLLDIYMHAIGM